MAGRLTSDEMLLLLLACSRPPEAPQGLDDASRYLLREVHSPDEVVGAGLTGLMDWYDAEGHELIGVEATTDNVDGFALADLAAEDVATLPVADDGRDLSLANGAVGLAFIDCSVPDAQSLLVRPDQDVVFEDFDAYERTYVTSREAFEGADPWPAVEEPLLPFDEAWDAAAWEEALLLTENAVTVTAVGTTASYTLVRHFRHGTYDVQGEPTDVWMGLAFVPEASTGSDGTVLRQNYGIELVIPHGDDVLRVFASWVHVDSNLIGPDSPIWQTNLVNTTRKSADRMSEICRGEVTLP
jgi:hypothetical protein